MKNLFQTTLLSIGLLNILNAGGMNDDPLNYKVTFEALQIEHTGDKPFTWDMNVWAGYNLNKIYIYSEGEKTKDEQESENQIVWSNAITPYWDIQYGIGIDKTSENTKKWAVLAFSGMSSYFFETRTAFLLDKNGNVGVRASAENDFLITQKLKIATSSEISAYSKDDNEYNIQKGLSALSVGVNLTYEIKREFAPYIGISHVRDIKNSKSQTNLVTGVSIWF
ncbi:Copper resistance protein B [hydrothermal vent metagenome]|uniref:Copper resistance protein B n=1 Tax=hydrothermal vent metagenome TaxID=652676 RepID=A0A3B1E9J6_9ZZZZ